MSKMGRPPVEHPKLKKVTIRMSDEDYEWLMKYNSEHNQTITDTVSEAIDLLISKDKSR